jgi:two-component system, NarL family, sensor histidine kinase UhpB
LIAIPPALDADATYRRRLRAALARELHDGAIQRLTGCVVKLEGFRLASDNTEMQSAISEIEEEARIALASLRSIIGELRGDEAPEDLAAAVRTMAARYQASTEVEVTVVTSPTWPDLLPADVTLNLLRIVQEAVTNAVRHGGAEHILLELGADDDRLRVSVTDDGRGIPGDSVPGSGVLGMRERAALLGGRFVLHRRDHGTEVRVEVPRQGGR